MLWVRRGSWILNGGRRCCLALKNKNWLDQLPLSQIIIPVNTLTPSLHSSSSLWPCWGPSHDNVKVHGRLPFYHSVLPFSRLDWKKKCKHLSLSCWSFLSDGFLPYTAHHSSFFIFCLQKWLFPFHSAILEEWWLTHGMYVKHDLQPFSCFSRTQQKHKWIRTYPTYVRKYNFFLF